MDDLTTRDEADIMAEQAGIDEQIQALRDRMRALSRERQRRAAVETLARKLEIFSDEEKAAMVQYLAPGGAGSDARAGR